MTLVRRETARVVGSLVWISVMTRDASIPLGGIGSSIPKPAAAAATRRLREGAAQESGGVAYRVFHGVEGERRRAVEREPRHLADLGRVRARHRAVEPGQVVGDQ